MVACQGAQQGGLYNLTAGTHFLTLMLILLMTLTCYTSLLTGCAVLYSNSAASTSVLYIFICISVLVHYVNYLLCYS